MVLRRLVTNRGGNVSPKYLIPPRWVKARERALLKAGFLPSEISQVDGGVEVGLLSLPLKRLRKLMKARQGQIILIMDIEDVDYREAQKIAARKFHEDGRMPGKVSDYFEYYLS